MEQPVRWTEKFFKTVKMKDYNWNEIPLNPPLFKN